MLSGPDLGGGYLHQLTTERDGDRTTFTYHAQDGGQDAGGPPKGPLDPFGFVHPPSACPFGGPRCWHRRFLLPFSETARVRPCYNRHRFVLETLLDQAYAGRAVDVETAVPELLDRLERSGLSSPTDFYIGGSAAAWLLGAPLRPRDVDVGVSRAAVDRVGAALMEYLIEPVATTDWPGVGIVRGGRAFVGTLVRGARVEWAVALGEEPRSPYEEWGGPIGGARTVSARALGRTVAVTRPEYALVRAAIKATGAPAPPLVDWLREFGPDLELFDALAERARLPAEQRAALRGRLTAEGAGAADRGARRPAPS